MMIIRLAVQADLQAVSDLYSDIHSQEEAGQAQIGWKRTVYPTRATAVAALQRGDLFVAENEGVLVGAAIINQQQVDVYERANWRYPAPESQVMVLHTLVISPKASGQGYGSGFVRFYETFAREKGCRFLRMDTNACNTAARALYQKLGYQEVDIVPCVFNGLKGVHLVLLEKRLD